MKTSPLPFQAKGIAWIERRQGRCLLADDMGLGKTFQTIGWISLHPEIRPIVIICPSSIKYVWEAEFRKHSRIKPVVLEGTKPYAFIQDICILNYDILHGWINYLIKLKPMLVVFDECQYVKNLSTNRTRCCKRLARKSKGLIALSGTPIVNRPIEYYSILNMLDPVTWNSKMKYGFRYCGPKRGWGGAWDFRGASNLDELHRKTLYIVKRRLKVDVMSELPKKRRIKIPVKTDLSEYRKVEASFVSWLEEKQGEDAVYRALKAEMLVKMGHMMRVAAQSMLGLAREWIEDYLSTDRKLVVFSIHRSVQDELRSKFKNACYLDGTLSSKERHGQVLRFQTQKKYRVLFGTLRCAGVGWTLTEASSVLFLETGFVPGWIEQAEDRVLRIGQKAQSIESYFMIPKDTILEEVFRIVKRKKGVLTQVLDGKKAKGFVDIVSKVVSRISEKGGAL